jgi:hypothetical protein
MLIPLHRPTNPGMSRDVLQLSSAMIGKLDPRWTCAKASKSLGSVGCSM